MKRLPWFLIAVVLVAGLAMTGCKPKLTVSAESIHFDATKAPVTFKVTNDGGGKEMAFTVKLVGVDGYPDPAEWLDIDPASATVTKDSPEATVTVALGYYKADVTAEANIVVALKDNPEKEGNTITIPVTTAPEYYSETVDAAELQGLSMVFDPSGYGQNAYNQTTGFAADLSDIPGDLITEWTEDTESGEFYYEVPELDTAVPYYGDDYTQLYVGAYGWVSFGEIGAAAVGADADAALAAHFSKAQISLFPLDATAGGDVYVSSVVEEATADPIVVTYAGVPTMAPATEKQDAILNDIQLRLGLDGLIEVDYVNTDTTAGDVIIGCSPGGGTPTDFVDSDLVNPNTYRIGEEPAAE